MIVNERRNIVIRVTNNKKRYTTNSEESTSDKISRTVQNKTKGKLLYKMKSEKITKTSDFLLKNKRKICFDIDDLVLRFKIDYQDQIDSNEQETINNLIHDLKPSHTDYQAFFDNLCSNEDENDDKGVIQMDNLDLIKNELIMFMNNCEEEE